jgi:hypothetical protein
MQRRNETLEGAPMSLPVVFSIEEKDGEKWVNVLVGERIWSQLQSIELFSDIAEALLSGSFRNICYDLSRITMVSSRLFGICFNIINKAEETKKKVSFRLHKDAMETAILANFHKRAHIEVV